MLASMSEHDNCAIGEGSTCSYTTACSHATTRVGLPLVVSALAYAHKMHIGTTRAACSLTLEELASQPCRLHVGFHFIPGHSFTNFDLQVT